MKSRILVIGGLAAGPAAAAKAKRTNPDADVVLFEQGEHVSYGICEIPYFVGNIVHDAEKLEPFTPLRLEREKGVKVKTQHRVEEIHPTKKHVVVRDLYRGKVSEEAYSKLIIATGSRPKMLDAAGETARNVFRVKSLDEAIGLKKFVETEKPRHAVVIGGGYIGMEMCEAFRALGLETTLVLNALQPMMRLEKSTRLLIEEELKRHNVHIMPGQSVRAFATDPSGKATAVELTSGSVAGDLFIVGIGVQPSAELAMAAKIRLGPHHAILTDQRQATSIDGIYAAGDCCELKNVVTNKPMYIPLATYAARQGRVAGENAAGGSVTFKGGIRAIAMKLFDLEVVHVGISSEEAREAGMDALVHDVTSTTAISFMPESTPVHITAVVDKKTKRILGANVAGGIGSAARGNVLAVAIQQRLTIDEVAALDLVYAPPVSPLWDPVLTLAHSLQSRF